MMEKIFTIVFFTFSTFVVYGQVKKSDTEKNDSKVLTEKFVDDDKGFEIQFPDSITPLILGDNEDIKPTIEPFVIEIYKEQEAPFKHDGKPVFISMEAIPDDCYQFMKVYTNQNDVELKEFLCVEGAAGTSYYSFIYLIEREHYNVLLKFVNKSCIGCLDEEGKTKALNKDMLWITNIIDSAKFTK
jgi:hypothetical protein